MKLQRLSDMATKLRLLESKTARQRERLYDAIEKAKKAEDRKNKIAVVYYRMKNKAAGMRSHVSKQKHGAVYYSIEGGRLGVIRFYDANKKELKDIPW